MKVYKVMGIDTGMRNLGVSVVNTRGKVVHTAHVKPYIPGKYIGLYWLPHLLDILFQFSPDMLVAESVYYGGKSKVSGLLSLCPMLGTLRDAWYIYAAEKGKDPSNIHVVTTTTARQRVMGKGNYKKTTVEDYYIRKGLGKMETSSRGKEKASLSSHEYDATLLADWGLHSKYNCKVEDQ